MGSLARRVNRLKAKFDKLVLKYQFKKAELEECKLIMQEAMEQFRIFFDKGAEKLSKEEYEKLEKKVQAQDVKHNEAQQKHSEQQKKQEEKAESEPSSELKSLYREIAKETHPDKLLESDEQIVEEKTRLFKEAHDAVGSKNWFRLREIASGLGLEPPEPTEEQIKLLEASVKEIEAKITSAHKTVAWNWFHFGTEEAKEDYIEQYIKSLLE